MSREDRDYRYIKDLVFDVIHGSVGKVSYEDMAREVKARFPESAWKRSHWAWYRTQIRKGRYEGEFSEEERTNLYENSEKKTRDADNRIKRLGNAILDDVRAALESAADGDTTLRFKLNRWVFARLQQDERKAKQPIKQELWDLGMTSCQACGTPLETLKGVECHRVDSSREYSLENCELRCKPCHQRTHRSGD